MGGFLLQRNRLSAWALALALASMLAFAAPALAAEPEAVIESPKAGALETARQGEAFTLKVTGLELFGLVATGKPAWLEVQKISPQEWTLSGTPTAAETGQTLTLEPSNNEPKVGAAVPIELVVHAALAKIEAPATINGTVGKAIKAVTIKGTDLASLKSKEPLPEGLKLTAGAERETEWTITGTPKAPLAGAVIALEAENSEHELTSAEVSITVHEAAPTLEGPATETSIAGSPIAPIVLKGSNLAELSAVELPSGLILTQVSETQWTITGTPTTAKAATTVELTGINKEKEPGTALKVTWTVEAPAKATETPAPGPTTTTPPIASAGRLGTVPTQKLGTQLLASFLCEVTSCKVSISATITAGKTKLKIHSARTQIAQGKKVQIPLKLSKQQRQLISAALRKHKKVTAALSARIDSSVGMQSTKALTITIKR